MADDGEGLSLDFKQIINLLATKYAVWLLIVVGFVVHFNGLFGAFIGDDKGQIQFNYVIQSLRNIPHFFTGSTFVPNSAGALLAGPFYKPFLSLSYSVLWALFTSKTFYYHTFQLALHLTNGVLIFVLFKKFLRDHIAFFLALLFIVHPINTEAVVYIADLQEPLYFCFGIIALLLSIKETISPARATAIGALLLCSLLSKETGILFVCMVIVTRLFMKWSKREALLTLAFTVPPVLVYLFLRLVIAKMFLNKIPGMPITMLPFSQRLLTVPAVVFFYLKTTAFPATLDFFQIWVVRHAALTNFYLPLLIDSVVFAATVALGWYLYHRNRSLFLPYLFFGIWFLIGIGFHSQIVPLDLTVSERWFYFPIVGLLGLLGVTYQCFADQLTKRRALALSMAALEILVLVLFSVRTVVRNSDWSNEITLYSHDLAVADSSLLESNLGTDYRAENNYPAALVHYQKSAALDPTLATYYNIAAMYMSNRDFINAQTYYLKALAANSTQRDHDDYKFVGNMIFENLTFTYIASHDYARAESLAAQAVITYPRDGRIWENLAVSQYLMDKKSSARHAAINALALLPNDQGVQYVYQQIATNQPVQIGN